MQRRRLLSQLLLEALRVLLYLSLLAAFVFMLSFTNRHLLRINRTSAITYMSFSVMLVVFSRIYGGFRIGQERVGRIVYQLSFTALFADVITYVQLQIMNVNARRNDSIELFGADMLLLAGAFVLQLIVIGGITYLGDLLYFKTHPPQKCCVVTGSARDLALIRSKINRFSKRFQIAETADYRDSDLYDKIRMCDTVMLFHLPANVHQELIERCYKLRKGIYFDLSIADILAQNAGSFLMDDVLMTAHIRSGLSIKQRFFKRTLDIVVASLGLVLTSPIMLAAAIAIKLDDGGPIIYRQNRLTRGDKQFRIYKFRTMRNDKNARECSVFKDDDRITKAGRVLRKLRIDELPQLINILKGEMSVVGPRPEMLSNFNRYVTELPEFSYRCRVKAGLTGYAQILGKYNTEPREKLMMDISYIENYSLWLDIKLMLKTVTVLFKSDSTEPYDQDPSRASDEAM